MRTIEGRARWRALLWVPLMLLATTFLACEYNPENATKEELATCEGEPGTIGIGYHPNVDPPEGSVYEGTPERDVVIILNGPVTFLGLGGDDLVCIRDTALETPPGAVITIELGDGDDRVVNESAVPLYIDAGAGDDVIVGGSGDDVINGGPGNDRLEGGGGDDVIDGGPGADILHGGPGDDVLYGGPGDDVLVGGPGQDHCDGGDGDEVTGDHAHSCETTVRVEHHDLQIVSPGPGHTVFGIVAVVLDYEALSSAASIEVSIDGSTSSTLPVGATTAFVDLSGVEEGPHTIAAAVLDDNDHVVAATSVEVVVELVEEEDLFEELHDRYEAGTLSADEYLVAGLTAVLALPHAEHDHAEATGDALGQLLSAWSGAGPSARQAVRDLHRVIESPGADTDPFPLTGLSASAGGEIPLSDSDGILALPDLDSTAAQADCPEAGPLTWAAGLIFEQRFCGWIVTPESFADPGELPGPAAELTGITWYLATNLDRTDANGDGAPDQLVAATLRLWEAELLFESHGFELPGVHRNDGVPINIFVVDNDLPAYSSPFDESEGDVLGIGLPWVGSRYGHPIRLSGPKGHINRTIVHELMHTFQWSTINWTWDIGAGSNGKRSLAFYESGANWGVQEYSAVGNRRWGYDANAVAEKWLSEPSKKFLDFSGSIVSPDKNAYAWFPALEWLDEHGGAAGPVSSSGLLQRAFAAYKDHRWGVDPIDLIEDQIDDGQFASSDEGLRLAWPRMWAALYLLTDGDSGSAFDHNGYRWAHFWGSEAAEWERALDAHPDTSADAFGAARPARLSPPFTLTGAGSTFVGDEFTLQRGGAGFQDFILPEGREGVVRLGVDPLDRDHKYEAFAVVYRDTGHPDVCIGEDGNPVIVVSDGARNADGSTSIDVPYRADCPFASVGAVHIDANSSKSDDFRILATVLTSEEPLLAPENLTPPTIEKGTYFGHPTFYRVSPGTWTVTPGTYTHRWLRCDGSGNGCVPIDQEWSTCYPTPFAEVGSTARLEITAIGEGGRSDPVRSNALAIEPGDFDELDDPGEIWFTLDPEPPTLPAQRTMISRLADGSQNPAGAFTSYISPNGGVVYANSFGAGTGYYDPKRQLRIINTASNGNPSFSETGRYVVFRSYNGTSGHRVGLADIGCGGFRDITVNPATGARPPGWYFADYARVTSDGRYVVFALHDKGALIEGESFSTERTNIYRFDQETGELDLVSATAGGQVGDDHSGTPDISDDGRFVAFWTRATNLGGSSSAGGSQVVRKDMVTGGITVLSAGIPQRHTAEVEGGTANCSCGEGPIRISDDGTYVSYVMRGRFFDGGTTYTGNPTSRIENRMYRWGGGNLLINAEPHIFGGMGASMSGDGQWLVFESTAAFSGEDTNGLCDTYLTQIGSGSYTLVSKGDDGTIGNGRGCALSDVPDISRDGRFVTYISEATNLLSPDLNDWTGDLWVFDRDFGG